jgi:hypothetical protein
VLIRLSLLGLLMAGSIYAQQPAPPPSPPAEIHLLDFWLGNWAVFLAGGPKDGDNRVEKMLAGYAIQENWTELDGHEGKSWFYNHRQEKRWK